MSAKNGLTRAGRRAIGICLVLALVGSAVLASSASAKVTLKPTNIIALGDSISFGYSQEKFEANAPEELASGFEGGFVNRVAKKLHGKEKKAGNELTAINLSCPGEVSDGLIGENEALGGGQEAGYPPKSDSAPCGWHNETGFPTHFPFGSASQLEAAYGILSTPGDETKGITLQIGANDELKAVGACKSKAWLEYRGMTKGEFECDTVEAGPPTPEEGKEEFGTDKLTGQQYYKGGLFGHIISNLGDTVGVIRSTGYAGPIAVLGFYNPYAFLLPGSDTLQIPLNQAAYDYIVTKKAFGAGVSYANPFPKFNAQKGEVKEKASVCKYTEECNEKDKAANYIKFLSKTFGISSTVAKEWTEATATEVGEKMVARLEEFGKTHAEAEAIVARIPKSVSTFPEGDIHPTEAGHKWMAKIIEKALEGVSTE